MFKTSLLSGVAALTVLSAPIIVHAQSINPTQSITVSPGYGVTVIPASPIYKLWIDDGSRLGVDFDRPPEEGATILHIYQDRKASNTFSADGNTMMTLVSRDGQIQKIAVNFGTGKIQNNILDLSQTSSSSAQFAALNPSVMKSRIEVIRAGLRRAIAQGSIPKGGRFNLAIERYLGLMEQGESLESASEKTGVMMEVIGKLAKMGVEEKGYQLEIPSEEQLQVDAGEVQRVTFTLKDFDAPETVTAPKKRKKIKPDVLRVDQEVSSEAVLIASKGSAEPKGTVRVEEELPITDEVETAKTPDSLIPIASMDSPIASLSGGMDTAKQLERGLSKLIQQGEVKRYSQDGLNIQKMIGRVKWGESPRFAARKSDVDETLTSRLFELGKDAKFYDSHGMANAIVRGLSVANRTGEIGRNARLSWHVQDVIWQLRKGSTLEKALYRSGVTQANAQRLLQLGNYQKP